MSMGPALRQTQTQTQAEEVDDRDGDQPENRTIAGGPGGARTHMHAQRGETEWRLIPKRRRRG